nr:hypothetical protein [Alistipes sp. D31t1_170403_E11]
MIQPAGYIRIIAEELIKNNRSVFGKVVTGIEHVTVGLPFVNLLQPPSGDPEKRIDPEKTAKQFDSDTLGRMTMTNMAPLVTKNNLTSAPFVSFAQKNRMQKGKRSSDLRMFGKGIRPAVSQRGMLPRDKAEYRAPGQPLQGTR